MAAENPHTDVNTEADADLVEELRAAVAEANEQLYETKRQLEHDRQVTARVHRSLLPSAVKHPAIDVDVRYLPIETIGGDYCQVRFTEPSICYITLCHVSGGGIGPALLATRVSSEVRHFILDGLRPSEIVRSLNTFIYEHFHNVKMHLTFMAARLDLDRRTVSYSGAGHPGALHLRPDRGLLQRLTSQNTSIGVSDKILTRQPERTLLIAAGDRLLFFTEGVTRTAGVANRQLGQSGLANFAAKALSSDLFEMPDLILDQVARFRSGPANDDLTLIVAEIK